MFANPRPFSQLTASFFACRSQGILRTPLLLFLLIRESTFCEIVSTYYCTDAHAPAPSADFLNFTLYLVVISQYFQRSSILENSQPSRSPFQGDGLRLTARRLCRPVRNLQRTLADCGTAGPYIIKTEGSARFRDHLVSPRASPVGIKLQKGGVPATPSGTATLLRLSPSYHFRPRPLLSVTDFRRPRLPWLDGRCVQGPGTYSPRHG